MSDISGRTIRLIGVASGIGRAMATVPLAVISPTRKRFILGELA